MLASLAGAVTLAAIVKTEGASLSPYELWPAVAAILVLGGNFLYMLQAQTPEPRTRLGRMIRYWFEAKEKELQSRANKTTQAH